MSPRRPAQTQPADPTPRGGELIHTDPAALHTTANVREDLRLDPTFQASIAELGVQVPIVAVRGQDGTLTIEQGHRRAAAAVAAGLSSVPVVVLDAAAAEAQRLLVQLAENQARAGLTKPELVAAHQQLALLGVSLDQAARATGTTGAQVRAARTIAGDQTLSNWLDANEEVQLDLETIATLGEFADDPELQAELANAATTEDGFDFARAVEAAREDRAQAARLADAAVDWHARGWAGQTSPHWSALDPRWVPTWRLRAADGGRVEADDLADCPGRAVALRERWDYATRTTVIEPVYYVINPTEHGFTPEAAQAGSRSSSEVDKQAQSQQRREVLANNKAWRAAEKVRREHVRSWLATAKPDPAILRWTLGELLRGVGVPHDIVAMKWAADVLRGSHPTKVNTHATGPRASIGALALVLADRELATSVESWRHPYKDSPTSRYLAFLTKHTGYRLSDVEALAAGTKKAAAAARAAEPTPADTEADAEVDNGAAQDVDLRDADIADLEQDTEAEPTCADDDQLGDVGPDPLVDLGGDPLAQDSGAGHGIGRGGEGAAARR